jgi:hypothetical protein
MKQYIVWQGKAAEYLVVADSAIRAIQTVLEHTDTVAASWEVATLDSYSIKAQTKILNNAVAI